MVICETVGPGGKTWYSFYSMQEGHKRSTESTMELHRGKTKLKQEEFKALEETMEHFDWKQFGSPMRSNASSGSGARQPLAIADAPKLIKWESIESHLVEAKAAQDRLMRISRSVCLEFKKEKDGMRLWWSSFAKFMEHSKAPHRRSQMH